MSLVTTSKQESEKLVDKLEIGEDVPPVRVAGGQARQALGAIWMANPSTEGEHATVVLADISRRPKIGSRVIVFANEKGGVGKSTLAFHTAVSLAKSGEKVLAIDLDRRQQSLAHALENRAATCRSLGVELPGPRSLLLEHHSGAMLAQEIARVGADCSTIIVDVPGNDSPIARRAIALADKLITPVNANFVDLDSIARFSPATGRLTAIGSFAKLVAELREARIAAGFSDIEWLLVKNRVRHSERLQLDRFDAAARQLPAQLDLSLVEGLPERVAFRDLFMFGLIHDDCRMLPGLNGARIGATPELAAMLQEVGLIPDPLHKHVQPVRRSRPPARSLQRYRQSLQRHVGIEEPVSAPL